MAREHISDLWGGRPPQPHPRLARFVLSVVCAIPLAFISLAIADNTQTPDIVRLLIAPGYLLGLHAISPNMGFLDSLGRFGKVALTVNTCYYALLLAGILSRWSRPRL